MPHQRGSGHSCKLILNDSWGQCERLSNGNSGEENKQLIWVGDYNYRVGLCSFCNRRQRRVRYFKPTRLKIV